MRFFPFISRSTYDEVARQRDEFKKELEDLKQDFKKYTNQIVFRATGMALDPELLPKPYQPKVKEPVDPYADPKPEATGPVNVRARLKQVEEAREMKFEEENSKIHAVSDASKGA